MSDDAARAAPRPRLSDVPRPALALGLAGLIPFAAGAVGALALDGPGAEAATQALSFYGAAILSFMGGCRWGFAAAGLGAGPGWVPLSISVLPALFAWCALLIGGDAGLLLLAVSLTGLWAADLALTAERGAPAWWPALRLPLSSGAVAALLVALLA